MGAPGGPPRGPASETKHSRPRNATGWGPREHETTQPKPRARLAGGPLGPPKSIAKAHSRYQERDWLGAPRGRPAPQRPACNNTQQKPGARAPGAAKIDGTPRTQKHRAETVRTTGNGPRGKPMPTRRPNAKKHTQPKPEARLAGDTRGRPHPQHSRKQKRTA